MRSGTRSFSLLLSLSVVLAGCASVQSGAETMFARKYSCPEDRIVVRERKDLKWSAIVFAKTPGETPPDEVSQDPERLAKWQSDKREEYAARADALDRADVFQATGCGHDVLLGCGHPVNGKGTLMLGQVSCTEARP